jgi:dTDP-glucose 4,6-dehydratase/UDP-glucose 4-epimerase
MNILIFGSKGFIGSHILAYFSQTENCYCADVVEDKSISNYFCISRMNPDFMEIFSKVTVDVCINASGSADVSASIINPEYDFVLNTINVEKMLEAIRLTQKKCKYILFSSAAVYGEPERLPISEDNILKPISPYGFHKKMAEEICSYYRMMYGIETCCLRPFSVYGNGIKKQVIWDITNKILHNGKVELFGKGIETRDFIHITDVVQSIDLIIHNTKEKIEIINIANGQQHSIAEIANIIKGITKLGGNIIFSNRAKDGYPLFWEADISVLKKLGYKNKVSLIQGLQHYIDWVKSL